MFKRTFFLAITLCLTVVICLNNPVPAFASGITAEYSGFDLNDYHIDLNELYFKALKDNNKNLNSKHILHTSAYLKNNSTSEVYNPKVYSTTKYLDETTINGKVEQLYVSASYINLSWDLVFGENDWDTTGGVCHTSLVYYSTTYYNGMICIKPLYMTGSYYNHDYPQVTVSNRMQRFSLRGFVYEGYHQIMFDDFTNWTYCSNSYTKYAPSLWPYVSYTGYYETGSHQRATLTHISGSSWTFISYNRLYSNPIIW